MHAAPIHQNHALLSFLALKPLNLWSNKLIQKGQSQASIETQLLQPEQAMEQQMRVRYVACMHITYLSVEPRKASKHAADH